MADRPRDARAWMALQLDTLFERDTGGRLVRVRSEAPLPVPRVFLGRTCAGNVWAVHGELPEALARELERVLAGEPLAQALAGEPPRLEKELRALLADHATGRRWQGPAFHFPVSVGVADAAHVVRADAETLARFAPLADDPPASLEPCVLALEGGEPVAACHAARRSAAACEAGVETLPAARGRGHGRAVVEAWARAVRELGLEPLYSTSWENTASRALARSLDLVCYGEDWHLG